jgi:hypothetical protein
MNGVGPKCLSRDVVRCSPGLNVPAIDGEVTNEAIETGRAIEDY